MVMGIGIGIGIGIEIVSQPNKPEYQFCIPASQQVIVHMYM